GAVARPISAGVAVLLYVDLRMRREGLDLVLQTAAGSGGAPTGDEFASLWRPGGQAAQPGQGAGPGAGTGPEAGAGSGPGGPRGGAAGPGRGAGRWHGTGGGPGQRSGRAGGPGCSARPGPSARWWPADVVIRAASIPALRGPAVLAAPGGGVPVTGRQAGQRLARTELSKVIYHHQPSLTERIAHFLLTWLARLFHATQGLPGGWWGFVALVVLAVILVAVVLARIGPVARAQRRQPGPGAVAPVRTAREHRAAAIRLAEAGDYAAAICERVRAIAAELDERGILMPSIGRTADEFAAEAGRALPPHAAGLLGAARLFDEVRYGRRPGTRAGYERVAGL